MITLIIVSLGLSILAIIISLCARVLILKRQFRINDKVIELRKDLIGSLDLIKNNKNQIETCSDSIEGLAKNQQKIADHLTGKKKKVDKQTLPE